MGASSKKEELMEPQTLCVHMRAERDTADDQAFICFMYVAKQSSPAWFCFSLPFYCKIHCIALWLL